MVLCRLCHNISQSFAFSQCSYFISPRHYQSELWFSNVFRDYKTRTLGRNSSSFLTHFSPLLLFYITCKRQKTLGLLLLPGGKKSEHWEEMGEIISYLCWHLQRTVFSRSSFSSCFRIFKWIVRKYFLLRVTVVHKQPGIGIQINTLQTERVEINLIQCCLNVTTIKQR